MLVRDGGTDRPQYLNTHTHTDTHRGNQTTLQINTGNLHRRKNPQMSSQKLKIHIQNITQVYFFKVVRIPSILKVRT